VNQALAIFAGGPFWALEAAFEGRPGVVEAVAGYTGGRAPPRSYAEVVEGGTGHCLAVAVLYDKRRTRFGNLVDIYWRAIDPTARNRQFSDTGAEFRTVIFWKDSAQKAAAEASLRKPPRPFGGGPLPGPVTVAVEKAMPFYPAEPAHQDYHRKYPGRYRMWLRVSGREEGLQSIWGGGGGSGAGGGAGAHSSRSRRDSQ
jgi:methionine-S-sulfoxide reductase